MRHVSLYHVCGLRIMIMKFIGIGIHSGIVELELDPHYSYVRTYKNTYVRT